MKKVFKGMGIVAATIFSIIPYAIFGMALYTNAFPIEVKAGIKWVEVERDSYYFSPDDAAALSREYPERWCYNYDTDQFWENYTRTFYWKGFDVSFIYT